MIGSVYHKTLTGAVLIFPRLAFVTLANNLMILSIRSMLTEFFCKFVI